MTRFEYVAIFYGIVVALAVETVLASVQRLLVARKRVRWHWMAPATALNATLLTLGEFWTLWGDREAWKGSYSVFQFLPFAVSLFFLFLTASATLPDEVPAEGVDLKTFYFDNRRHYWGLVAAFFAFSIALNLANLALLGPGGALWQKLRWLVGDVVALAIATPLIIFRAPWLHALGIALSLLALLAYLASIQL